jgi:hypothetical protein
MSTFTEIDAIFVNEFAELYSSGEYKQYTEYGEYIQSKHKKAYWRLTDINGFRQEHDIGFSPAIYQFTYLLCDYDPLSIWDERLESDTFRKIWDENRLDIRNDITSPNSMFSKIYKKIKTTFNNTKPIPTIDHFFTHTFTKICEVYRDINTEVQRSLNTIPINKLIDDNWFTFDEEPSTITHFINNMITNCLEDPYTMFTQYEFGDNNKVAKSYSNIYRRTKHNQHQKDNKDIKYVFLPSIDTCIEIFWENAMKKPATHAIQPDDHYLKHAQSYNQYTDSIDYLNTNIIKALTMLEVDSRFKDALKNLTKPHITCSGCREDQANQLAHTGEGGCLSGDFDAEFY